MNRVTTAHPPVGVNTATRPRDSAAEKPKDSRMSDFRCKEKERLSRQEVAEWLTDIAYALTTGGRLKLDGDAEVEDADRRPRSAETREQVKGRARRARNRTELVGANVRPEASSTEIPPDRNQGRRQVPEQVAEAYEG